MKDGGGEEKLCLLQNCFITNDHCEKGFLFLHIVASFGRVFLTMYQGISLFPLSWYINLPTSPRKRLHKFLNMRNTTLRFWTLFAEHQSEISTELHDQSWPCFVCRFRHRAIIDLVARCLLCNRYCD